MRFSRSYRYLWCLVTLLLLPASLGAGGGVTVEKVRASFLLQMQKFVLLGAEEQKIGQICYYEKPGVTPEESVGQILTKYLSDNPGKFSLTVKHFSAIRDFSGCDLVYIPSSEEGNVDNILSALDGNPTLTASPAKRFIHRGGMIGFVLDNQNRVKMEANLKNIREKQIRIDAQLLEIMQHVVN